MGVLLLPSQPHRTRERIDAIDAIDATQIDLSEIAVLIPARNEAVTIERTLTALAYQGQRLKVLVVDDESTDETAIICAAVAKRISATTAVEILRGASLPAGWGGKVWAVQQGFSQVERPYTLLLDADVELAPGVLSSLLRQARTTDSALVSLMATLRCESFWERLLVPPFIFFFKLLYPFACVNDKRRGTAAAAGGCMLVETEVLREIDAFSSIRGALIDDCSLAKLVKQHGHGVWLGLSRSVRSLRAYVDFADFAQMVKRTAFTQLRYSSLMLLLVTATMLAVFLVPFLGLGLATGYARLLGGLAIIAMYSAYVPTLKFYGISYLWLLTLPVAGMLFLVMTWGSALNYWRGVRAEWKDRAYAVE